MTSQHGSSLDGSLLRMLSAFWTASPSSLGRSTGPERPVSGAMASLVVPRLPALRSGRRQRACAARRSTAGCYPPFQQHLLPRFSRYDRLRGPAPTASLRQRFAYDCGTHVGSRPASPAARARIARRSSGECQGGCGVQAASLRPPPTRRGAAVGAAAGLLRCGLHHRVLSTSPTPPAARRCLGLPCHQADTHTHTHTSTHTLLIIG